MLRNIRFATAVAVLLTLFTAGSAAAAGEHAHGPIMGVVHSRGKSHGGGGGGSTSKDLIFHGGSVLNGDTVYAIYWSPPGFPIASSYVTLINRFYGDVQAATGAGATSDVYYTDTQYGNGILGSTSVTLGSLTGAASFGGYLVDHNQLPKSGCKDRYTSVCVTDAQIIGEISHDTGSSATGWQSPSGASIGTPRAGGGNIFFMFTAEGVGSCYGRSCSFSQWCAYHSSSGSLLYANMPFADTVPAACDAGYHPNASIDPYADATINVASHEHNETITDPFGTAWYNSSGYEDGDLCAWNFGSMLGGSGASSYNQVINGHEYTLQQEWSNYSSRCVLTGV